MVTLAAVGRTAAVGVTGLGAFQQLPKLARFQTVKGLASGTAPVLIQVAPVVLGAAAVVRTLRSGCRSATAVLGDDEGADARRVRHDA